MVISVDRSMDIELEQTSLYIVLSVFAAQIYSDSLSIVVYQDEDYFLVARRISESHLIYEVAIWRTCEFEDVSGVLFSVAHFPGIVGVTYDYQDWNSIPINQAGTRSIFGPMHGVVATFAYPDDQYEISSFNSRALDTY